MSVRGVGVAAPRLILLAVLAACASTAEMPLAPVESGAQSNVSDQSFYVLVDPESFRALHASIHAQVLPPRPPPAIDFKKRIVLVAFLGTRPTGGYAIGFGDTATVEGKVATVTVVVDPPPADAILPTMVTTPYALATLRRGDYDQVVFVDSSDSVLERLGLGPHGGRSAARATPSARRSPEPVSRRSERAAAPMD